MPKFNLYWGDLHKHLEDFDRADEIVDLAKHHLDFYCVLCYPFKWELVKGARVETVRQRPEFQEWWGKLRTVARKHNTPGTFVTFLGYEWHGNRTLYGDHNVIYRDEDNPLDDSWSLEDLYENLRRTEAFAIPHHTGYRMGRRGKNWAAWDPDLSPVTEIFSSHGSSEGTFAPGDMTNNNSMGPLVSGGTLTDALDRGHHVGVIASNDGPGLPGSWPRGVAGVWAEELTRAGIWEAIKSRRTVAATGDRISLWFTINGFPMGSVLEKEPGMAADVIVSCPQPLDRIELIHNGVAERSYVHAWRAQGAQSGTFRVLIEFGWGPSSSYGFRDVQQAWTGAITVEPGEILRVFPRFGGLGQRYQISSSGVCQFVLRTNRDQEPGFRQGLILEVRGETDAVIKVTAEGREFDVPLADALSGSHLFPFLKESVDRVESQFGISEGELENPDIYYHNARKIRVHPAYPREACEASVAFENLRADRERDYYYARVTQIDGQIAWSSPIWLE